MDVLGFNAKNKSIIIASNECSPIQRNIFSVDTKTGKRKMIDDCGKGWHNATLSQNGEYIYDNYSTPTLPRKIAIVNTANGKRTATSQPKTLGRDTTCRSTVAVPSRPTTARQTSTTAW